MPDTSFTYITGPEKRQFYISPKTLQVNRETKMILFIITQDKEKANKDFFWKMKNELAELANDLCVDVHYSYLSRELLEQLRPWAVIHSGATNPDWKSTLEHPAYLWTTREYPSAQLGICRGHQLVAAAYGSRVDFMGPLAEDEPDLKPDYHKGLYKENGVFPVHPVEDDPIFNGLNKPIMVQETHAFEVKELGNDLILLASSRRCRVQVFRHRNKPIYGCQFHPELSPDGYPDGKRFLKNFFHIARQQSRDE